jgi:hypothetical protein
MLPRRLPRPVTLLAALAAVAALAAAPAHAQGQDSQGQAQGHDYPTAERVVFVQTCMRDHPGPHYEMLNKCSCVIDAIAREVPFDDFMTMNTAALATSIGGERGAYIRDVEPLQQQIRRFRQLQSQALKGCMVATERASR